MSDDVQVSASTPLADWLAELAQPTGAPGGGAASAVLLATSAALLRMVAEYTPGDPRASGCAERLASRRTEALDAAQVDGRRSAELGAALKLSADDPDREVRVRDAACAAARASVLIGHVGRALLSDLRLLSQISSPQLAADVAVAAAALAAGIAGAAINLRADVQTANRHGAPSTVVVELQAEARSLASDRSAAACISDQVAGIFDR
jgi:formiminotetrahydrofolate cyclodeaminase